MSRCENYPTYPDYDVSEFPADGVPFPLTFGIQDSQMPSLATPAVTPEADALAAAGDYPKVDPIEAGRMAVADSALQRMRNRNPFVQIDPSYSNSLTIPLPANPLSGPVTPTRVEIPQGAKMFRITFGNNSTNYAAIAFSPTEGGCRQINASASGPYYGAVVNPPPIWREVGGLTALYLATITNTTSWVSIEFYMGS